MTRKIRTKSSTGIYHVMLRGINRQDIFEDAVDYRKMILILRGLVERFDEQGQRLPPLCTVYAYCLMSNHIHLLIQEKSEDISGIAKRVGIAYAAYFNKRYERNGHLFQDRFRSEPVDNMEYFVILLRYIHQNPVKGGLVARVADYPWSSWGEYASNVSGFCCVEAVFKHIPSKDLEELVNSSVDGFEDTLDIESKASMKDHEVRTFLMENYGISNPLTIQSLEKTRRNEVLLSARTMGAGIRQLSRMTGVSFGLIQKLRKK